MTDPNLPDFDTMTPADFERYLPDLFENGNGHITSDPRFKTFLQKNPVCAALVRDLEAIAEQAKSLFEPTEPSDAVWNGIAKKLNQQGSEEDDRPHSQTT